MRLVYPDPQPEVECTPEEACQVIVAYIEGALVGRSDVPPLVQQLLTIAHPAVTSRAQELQFEIWKASKGKTRTVSFVKDGGVSK